MANTPKQSRSTQQIESDIADTMGRLTGKLETFIDAVHPQRVKQRQIANVKARALGEIENAKAQVFNARGDLRTGRLAAIGGAVVGAITFLVVVSKLLKRSRAAAK